MDTGIAPGASAAVGVRRASGWQFQSGAAGTLEAHSLRPATTQTLYDLASITKSVTAVMAARLTAKHGATLATPLQDLLPESRGTASGPVPLDLLLSHRAGLAAHVALYTEDLSAPRPSRAEAIYIAGNARRSECSGESSSAGFPALYSDVGYVLVGYALEALEGAPLDRIYDQELGPLQLELRSMNSWREILGANAPVAPTETVAWRGGEICGVVHDENAFVLSAGGCSGHAGLFSTASAVAQWGALLLETLEHDTALLPSATLQAMLRQRPDASLRAGFDGKSETNSSAGERFLSSAFGHLGFTGTSYWCDPTAATVVVLLTNRVCPTRDNIKIRAARPNIHTELFDYAQMLTE